MHSDVLQIPLAHLVAGPIPSPRARRRIGCAADGRGGR